MKRFVKKSAVAISFILAVYLAAVFTADGTIDAFYLRFTTPTQTSLILGTSRAAQTFQPRLINRGLEGSQFEIPIFNFSFTLMHSPFGPIYLNAIKKKMDPKTTNGLFIIAVDPWSVSSICKDPDDIEAFRENGKLLDSVSDVVSDVNGSHPNLDYFLHLNKGVGKLFVSKIEYAITNSKLLHKDGWLEITVSMDESSIEKRIEKKVARAQKNLNRYKFSNVRFGYIEKTVSYLKQHGTVVLVRLPVSEKPLAPENKLVPGFDQMIQQVASDQNVKFINYQKIPGDYRFTDGSHLHKSSGAKISEDIARRILK